MTVAPAPDLTVLRQELTAARAEHGRRSSAALEAFERLFRAAADAGTPLDQLRRHTTNEAERFFAQTLVGASDHVYWDGPDRFIRNDRRQRSPRRWWWAHVHGAEPGLYEDIVATCGESNCINPDHCQKGRGLLRQRFSTESMLAGLRAATERLGHAPSMRDWDGLGLSPTSSVFGQRFGSWEAAMTAAGVTYRVRHGGGLSYTADDCVNSVLHVAKELGRMPSMSEFDDARPSLKAAGLPTSRTTIHKLVGNWTDVCRAAAKARKAAA